MRLCHVRTSWALAFSELLRAKAPRRPLPRLAKALTKRYDRRWPRVANGKRQAWPRPLTSIAEAIAKNSRGRLPSASKAIAKHRPGRDQAWRRGVANHRQGRFTKHAQGNAMCSCVVLATGCQRAKLRKLANVLRQAARERACAEKSHSGHSVQQLSVGQTCAEKGSPR